MISTIVISLFLLWLLGAFGVYSIGWFYHIFLVSSIILFFIAGVRAKKPEITEIMVNDGLSWTEAEQVKEIMNQNKLNEREAVELLRIRSKPHHLDNMDLLKTETGRVREIVTKNKLSVQEAVELLSIRLKLHH